VGKNITPDFVGGQNSSLPLEKLLDVELLLPLRFENLHTPVLLSLHEMCDALNNVYQGVWSYHDVLQRDAPGLWIDIRETLAQFTGACWYTLLYSGYWDHVMSRTAATSFDTWWQAVNNEAHAWIDPSTNRLAIRAEPGPMYTLVESYFSLVNERINYMDTYAVAASTVKRLASPNDDEDTDDSQKTQAAPPPPKPSSTEGGAGGGAQATADAAPAVQPKPAAKRASPKPAAKRAPGAKPPVKKSNPFAGRRGYTRLAAEWERERERAARSFAPTLRIQDTDGDTTTEEDETSSEDSADEDSEEDSERRQMVRDPRRGPPPWTGRQGKK
jgi:hypothetical protein